MEEGKYPEVSASHTHQSANCNLKNNASSRIQLQGKVFLCAICRESFLSEKHLKDHVHGVHTGGQPRVGDDNRTQVNSKPRKRKHAQRNMRHVCEVCQKDFSDKHYLLVHHRIHIGDKQYVCSVCEKAFTVRASLRTHFRTHTGEKPYPCETCGKKFARKHHLTVHMRVHTGEKPYVCDICQRGFSQKWVMYTHRRVHTGERPFECDLCQKGFIYKSQLKDHRCTHLVSEPLT